MEDEPQMYTIDIFVFEPACSTTHLYTQPFMRHPLKVIATDKSWGMAFLETNIMQILGNRWGKVFIYSKCFSLQKTMFGGFYEASLV